VLVALVQTSDEAWHVDTDPMGSCGFGVGTGKGVCEGCSCGADWVSARCWCVRGVGKVRRASLSGTPSLEPSLEPAEEASALCKKARVVRAARAYCSLERPYVSARAARPCSSSAVNLEEVGSSMKVVRVDISERKRSVAGEETEKRSRVRGTTRGGMERAVKMEV
jgi:hypothetical protein